MNPNGTTQARWRLVEIWGDTADLRHLAGAIAIGIAVSLAGFLLANRLLAGAVRSPELARAYAMLAGLAGCVIAGLICALLFAPKREVVEGGAADPRWREEVLAELAGEHGDLGAMSDLPPAALRELQELGLHDLFANYRPRTRAAAEGAAS
jgi:multidrug transporter EmrE-like cation transporter